jgi:hypothetical protein
MTFFIKIEDGSPTGYPILEENLRQILENSLPNKITPADVEPHGYGLYEFTVRPYVERYEKLVEESPKRGQDSIYYQSWRIENMTEEERSEVDAAKSREMRMLRDQKLISSDWSQLPDAPLTASQIAVWTAYRDQLRKVPDQQGFPWAIEWPTQP